MMNRRGFLARIAGGVVAATVAPFVKLLPAATRPIAAHEPTVLTVGDMFTINGCYAVNPLCGLETGHLQRFIVTAVVDSGGYRCWPPLIPDGPYRNVTGPRSEIADLVAASQATPLYVGQTIPCATTWAAS